MTLPTAIVAFLPLCDEADCNRPILGSDFSDFCALHSGCCFSDGTPGFNFGCGDEVVEVLNEEEGRCYAHRTTACSLSYCDADAIDSEASDEGYDLCPEHKDESDYEHAVEHFGYTGPRYRH
jgi:hypothetical protein